jgi:hypothetical protein
VRTEPVIHFRDLHATMLHQLGLDQIAESKHLKESVPDSYDLPRLHAAKCNENFR